MTENENGRPGGKPGAAVETNSAGGGAVEAIVRRHVPEGGVQLRDVEQIPMAPASMYAPGGRRKGLALSTQCPTCRLVTVHRLPPDADADGVLREGSCGHRYRLKVRSVYRPLAGEAA